MIRLVERSRYGATWGWRLAVAPKGLRFRCGPSPGDAGPGFGLFTGDDRLVGVYGWKRHPGRSLLVCAGPGAIREFLERNGVRTSREPGPESGAR